MSYHQKVHDERKKVQSFIFQNLQPINYLRTFNKMLQYMTKPASQQSSSNQQQLKLVKLSKFPLYSYYEQMEGIVEGNHKKHIDEEKFSKKNALQEQFEQKFLNKHHTIVKNALNKIIQDNQEQQNVLIKSKHFYQQNSINKNNPHYEAEIVKMVKMRSLPKLNSIKVTLNSERKKSEQKDLKNQGNYITKKRKSETTKSTQDLPNRKQIIKPSKNIAKTLRTERSMQPQQEAEHDKKLQIPKQTFNTQYQKPIFNKLYPPETTERFRKRSSQEIDYIINTKNNMNQKKSTLPLLNQSGRNTPNFFNNIDLKDEKEKNNQINLSNNFSILSKNQLIPNNISLHKQGKQMNEDASSQQDENEISQEQSNMLIGNQFAKEVLLLQNQQAKIQNSFGGQLQKNIKQTNSKLKQRMKAVKQFDYLQMKLTSKKIN